jgi:hypothetical protein
MELPPRDFSHRPVITFSAARMSGSMRVLDWTQLEPFGIARLATIRR